LIRKRKLVDSKERIVVSFKGGLRKKPETTEGKVFTYCTKIRKELKRKGGERLVPYLAAGRGGNGKLLAFGDVINFQAFYFHHHSPGNNRVKRTVHFRGKVKKSVKETRGKRERVHGKELHAPSNLAAQILKCGPG